MIEAYAAGNEDYEKNGDMTLFPEACTVTAELNGMWYMDIAHPLDPEGRWKYITEEAVIAAPTFMGKKQLFRINDVEKTDTEVSAKAYPVFFDSADDCFLADVRPTGKNGQQALNEMTAGSRYGGRSDITKGETAYFVRRNLMDAINGEESPTFLERWGGELLYDNYTVIINEQVGSDYGTEIRYGKNMAAVRYHIDMSGVVTRIVPVAFNGRMLSSPGYVDSPNIGKYAKKYIKELRFEQIRLAEDIEGEPEADMVICNNRQELDTALRSACEDQYASGIDLPAVTLEIDLTEISGTDEYRDFGFLERIGLGDTVRCFNRDLGISTAERAVKIVWDCIYDEVRSVMLGDFERNYFRDVSSSAEKIERVTSDDGSLMAEKMKGILDGMRTQLKMQNTAAKRQEARAILFEDLDPESELYGALAIGTQGMEISKERTEDGRDWKWTTAATAGGIVANVIITGLLSDKKGVNFWNLDTGEFVLSATAKIRDENIESFVQKKAEKAAGDAVGGITQEDVFNKLTNSGRVKGIWLKDGQLYFSFTYAEGGELVLGGANNGNGKMTIKDAAGASVGNADNTGIHFNGGTITLGNNFKVTQAGFAYAFSPRFVSAMYLAKSPLSDISSAQYKQFAGYVGDAMYLGDATAGEAGYIHSTKLFPLGVSCLGDITATGDISCIGKKSRLMRTENYSVRKLYCYEMPSPIFGDIGEGMTDETGECYICPDDVFLETINSNIEYQVFLQKEGAGDLWVSEKKETYFIVKGTKNLKFSWEIKVKQKDADYERLEIFDGSSDDEPDKESMYMKEIERLQSEREGILYEPA